MRKIFFLFFPLFLFADIKYVDWESINDIKYEILDISMESECQKSGRIKTSKLVPFYNFQKKYNYPLFHKKLNKKIKTSIPFVLLGNNKKDVYNVAASLSEYYNYKIIIPYQSTSEIIKKYPKLKKDCHTTKHY